MANIYYKEIFTRIPEKKQKKIIKTAISEFANQGFNSANINIIAKKAGVSVGSLYKYFETKENLFLTATHYGIGELEEVLNEITVSKDDIFSKIEQIFKILQKHSKEFPDLHRLYNEMTSEGNSDLIKKLSFDMESISAKCYTTLISEAKKDKIIASDIDEKIFAYCLDNIFLNFQFSYSCEYYKERLKIYVGSDVFNNDEAFIKGIMDFIKRAFSHSN